MGCPVVTHSSPVPSSQLWVLFYFVWIINHGHWDRLADSIELPGHGGIPHLPGSVPLGNTAQRFQQVRWWKVSPPHVPQPLIRTFPANLGVIDQILALKFSPYHFISLSQPFSLTFSLVGKQWGGPNPKCCGFYRCLDCREGELPWGCPGNHCMAMQTSRTNLWCHRIPLSFVNFHVVSALQISSDKKGNSRNSSIRY